MRPDILGWVLTFIRRPLAERARVKTRERARQLYFRVAAVLLVAVMAATAYGQELPLKVAIQSTRGVVENGKVFYISAKIENESTGDQMLHIWDCYQKHWVTDRPSVRILDVSCAGQLAKDVTLKPKEVYDMMQLPLSVSIPAGERTGQSVSFRLGFQQPLASEHYYGDPSKPNYGLLAPSGLTEPIWSNAIAVNVVPAP